MLACLIFAPSAFVLLLPAFSRLSSSTGERFAGSYDRSLSSYLTEPASNGGFALFTSPTIYYAWLCPATAAAPALPVRASLALFTAGWAGVILLPIDLAGESLHSSFALAGFFGFASSSACIAVGLLHRAAIRAHLGCLALLAVLSGVGFSARSHLFFASELALALLVLVTFPLYSLTRTSVEAGRAPSRRPAPERSLARGRGRSARPSTQVPRPAGRR